MLIENRSCDECGRHCGYLAMLGHYGRYSAQLCDDCLRKGREEIATALTDGLTGKDDMDAESEWKHFSEEERRWQELNLKRVGLGLAPYLSPRSGND